MHLIKRTVPHHRIANNQLDIVFRLIIHDDGGRWGMGQSLLISGGYVVQGKESFVEEGVKARPGSWEVKLE
jgi:hypothetical protein